MSITSETKTRTQKTAISTAGLITAVLVRSELLNAPLHQLEKKICCPSFRQILSQKKSLEESLTNLEANQYAWIEPMKNG